MSETGADMTIQRNDARSRYEMVVDGAVIGLLDYRLSRGRRQVFTHTEVDDAHQGRGLAERLVRFALDDARRSGRTVVAECPYVEKFIDEHPEYADLRAA
jgi:predicted GNAT family acetyltransferase